MTTILPTILLLAAVLAILNWVHSVVDWAVHPEGNLRFGPMLIAALCVNSYIYPNVTMIAVWGIVIVWYSISFIHRLRRNR
jgi:hypothetical protein